MILTRYMFLMANVKKLLYKRETCTKNALIYSNGEMAFEQNE